MPFKILTVDYLSENAPETFIKSLRSTGFAVIKNHPLSGDLVSDVYSNWRDFFKSSDKHNYPFHKKDQDGYFPYQSENARGYTQKDLKEFYHIYPWGRYPDEIRESNREFFSYVIDLGNELLDWIDFCSPSHISKNFSIPLSEMAEDSSENLLRVINYPALEDVNTHGSIRAQEHADINLITLLISATQPGLQVKNLNGKWIDVKCNPGELVVNTGDMLQECSGNYFPSTIHRVVNPPDKKKHKPRLSMPVFIHPDNEVILSKRYTAKSYLEERLKEIGLKQ